MKTLLLLIISLVLTLNVGAKDIKRPMAAYYSNQLVKKYKHNAKHNRVSLIKRVKGNIKYYERRRRTRINQKYYQYDGARIKLAKDNPMIKYENWNRRPTHKHLLRFK